MADANAERNPGGGRHTRVPAPPAPVASPPVHVERHADVFGTMSAVLPGLGQWFQGRRLIGALQLGTVLAYVATAMATENPGAAFLALAWNVWSSVDAFRHARREERWREEESSVSPDG